MTFTEKVISFGASRNLHGVLAEPDLASRIEGAPAVLTWNVGLHHHVGPYRYYVDLGRKLAEMGFSCLRFDVSGLGDSDASRSDSRSDSERALSDVRDAMAALRAQRGHDRFVLVGFCSGVDAAHIVAANDSNVAGMIYIEGYGSRTPGFYLRYPKRFLDPNRWERLIRRNAPWIFRENAAAHDPSAERERVFVREYPSMTKLRQDVLRMTDRGTKLLLVYVGGDTDYAYREQFYEMLSIPPDSPNIEVTYYPGADHTFFLEANRRQCIDRVSDWMKSSFGAGAGSKRGKGSAQESQVAQADNPPESVPCSRNTWKNSNSSNG